MATLQLEVVTPQGIVLDEAVDEVVAPSVNGEFGVLPGHLPLLAALQVGMLRFTKDGKSTDVAVGRGFAEVIDDKAIILTDRFCIKDDIEVLKVRERLETVDAKLDAWDKELNDPERHELIEEEQWLATQLELYGDPPPPRLLEMPARNFAGIMPDANQERPDDDDDA
ncbi:MAG: ATP synthase F1 subunit epsilon [Myxococcota bacterium]